MFMLFMLLLLLACVNPIRNSDGHRHESGRCDWVKHFRSQCTAAFTRFVVWGTRFFSSVYESLQRRRSSTVPSNYYPKHSYACREKKVGRFAAPSALGVDTT